MNNAALKVEEFIEPEDITSMELQLKTKEADLTKIIDALTKVHSSEEWKVLRNYVWDGVVESLERLQKQELDKKEINTSEAYRLQGQLAWARKYSNLAKLCDVYKTQLSNVREQLKNLKNHD